MTKELTPRGSAYEALSDIPMDKSSSLEQLTGRFQSVRDGLPELVKNSKDQYSRLNIVEKEQRQIVVLVSPDLRRMGVLDFGGASEADFAAWQVWSSPDAGRAGNRTDIEAGHGNGGKSFMVRGSMRMAYMCGFSNGRITKMGFDNEKPELRYHPILFVDADSRQLKSLDVDSPEEELNRELEQFGLTYSRLPVQAEKVFKQRRAFTIVVVDAVKEWMNSRSRETLVRRLPFDLANHPQAALTIETCSVWVMRGTQLLDTQPLSVRLPDPYPGFEQPLRIPVPDQLRDPRTKEFVDTGTGEKLLEVRTSLKPLRIGENRVLNVIRVKNDRNVVANWPIAELAAMASSTFLFGTLTVPSLSGDHLAGADRQALADTPLVRALREWVEEHLTEIAGQIQKAQVTRYTPDDRDATNETLRRLRELMRKFLRPEGGPNETHEFGSIIHEIVLEPGKTELTVPVGTIVPVVFKCYEKDLDRRLPVLKPKVHMVFDPVGVVKFNGFSSIHAIQPGASRIHLENGEGTVRSNEILVNAVEVAAATIGGPDRELKQGEIVQLDIRATDNAGQPVTGAVYQISLDELDLGRVGRTGVLTAGATKGTTGIQLRYGPEIDAVAVCQVVVGPDKVERPPPHPKGDVPLILLCGTPAPGREDLPELQRTHPAGAQYPTIIDFDPQWENVVWLNPESAEATKVRGSRGPTGAMGLRTTTFYQFLALKAFEVLRRLKVRQEFEDKQATSNEFLMGMSEAEIDTAPFLDQAYSIVEKLVEAVEPGNR